MTGRQPPSNQDLFWSFMLSAADLAQLLGCGWRHIYDCLVDQHGNSIRDAGGWTNVDHDRTEVWFEWPDGLRIRATRNRNGDLAFRTADAREAVGSMNGRLLHPSVAHAGGGR